MILPNVHTEDRIWGRTYTLLYVSRPDKETRSTLNNKTELQVKGNWQLLCYEMFWQIETKIKSLKQRYVHLFKNRFLRMTLRKKTTFQTMDYS